jgi:hypothetical protein
MELKFTEVDDLGNNKNYFNTTEYNTSQSDIVNTNNYWEKSKENNNTHTKKRVTYTDILSSLNLTVSPNGVLQYMTLNPKNDDFLQSQYQQTQYQPQYQPQSQYQQTQSRPNSKPLQNEKPLEPQVKNSYIFNKYFKDYKGPNVQFEEPKKPQTIEEYNRMLLEERIRRIYERKRIAQIKSTKLLFENNSTINVSKNNLRRMPFK